MGLLLYRSSPISILFIEIQYYENGKIKIEGIFKDGKANGIIKVYDENGQVALEEEWRDGVRVVK